MRQAGRYLPEFLKAKEGKDFFDVCRTPELCCELTLQPIRRYALDAAIIFSDILVIPQAMGLDVEMKPGKGPSFPNPLKSPEEIDTRLTIPNVHEKLGYVFQAITLTRHKLEGKVPLIGFSGAPWTLMAYMVEGEGTKTWSRSKAWLYKYPEDSHRLLKMITTSIISYLKAQVNAGAQLLQVFDSWAGELSPDQFSTFCLPYLRQIASEIKAAFPEIPLIVFAKGANESIVNISTLGYDVLGLDWGISPKVARDLVRNTNVSLQGNLDPAALFGDRDSIRREVRKMLNGFGTRKLIANLGHGLIPEHNPEHVGWFIDAIHEISEEINSGKSQ
eukprot:TRINITY_DN15600_c0_g1_i1.p1 TRINITY_DN15600_c0_g1~~TRINITY_DN15600_c0_g1_i1.p1  ORF type:complete len:368 (-),score=106.52 TRINITY_DN15600_c0_g1_i1:11-1006(-)